MPDELEAVRIGNLKLRASEIEGELEALRVASRSKFVWSRVNTTYVLVPSQPTIVGRNIEVFNLTPYFEQLGELDKNEVMQNVVQIEDIIVQTLKQLKPDEPQEAPGFQFHAGANLLIVTAQPDALEVARKVVNALSAQPGMPFYGGAPGAPIGSGFTGTVLPRLGPNARPISKERRAILAKLESVRLESVMFDGLPLSEVVRWLQDQVKKHDPDKHGINFLVDPNPPQTGPGRIDPTTGLPVFSGPPPAVDPNTGLPVTAPTAAPEQVDINTITIRINPALANVRLVDALDAIVRVADHPIKYTVTDYAVVFSLRNPDERAELSLPTPGKLQMY